MKRNTQRNQQGFTLIELLVVIAILAVLFGVTALALNGVGNNATTSAANGERDVVQTAIDVCSNTSSCTNPGAQSIVGSVGPASGGATGFGAYLRRTTRFFYAWSSTGQITRVCQNATCTGTNPPDPLYRYP